MSLADVQGNVICGYGTPFARFVFASVVDPTLARGFVAETLERVTFNESWEANPPEYTLNIAFTCAGLAALGVPMDSFEGLHAFAQGMAARAGSLGDVAERGPEHWEPGLGDSHVLVVLTAWERRALESAAAAVEGRLRLGPSGLEVRFSQAAAVLEGAREHFGFGDGFSQPAIAGANTGPRHGEGTLTKWRQWKELAIGEFILGYTDEGGLKPAAPGGALGQDATFMVVRKLEQDVAGFRAYVRAQARQFGRDEDWIGAKMVGRWQNGSPLAAYPDRPGPPASESRETINQFRYGEDPGGLSCPLGAHVRRSNPRDALGWEGRPTRRHRMLRRGVSYGPPLPNDAAEPDGHERGLMFVCYQASIERQFEFVQQQWLGDGNVFGLGDDRDPLVAGDVDGGPVAGRMVIQGSPPLFLSGLPRFVTVRGGDYFLLPGRAGLEALASVGWSLRGRE